MLIPSKCSILCTPLQGCKERGERGAASLFGMWHYRPRTLLEMEVEVVFNPYLEQLSL